jgi:hypothetical protein
MSLIIPLLSVLSLNNRVAEVTKGYNKYGLETKLFARLPLLFSKLHNRMGGWRLPLML